MQAKLISLILDHLFLLCVCVCQDFFTVAIPNRKHDFSLLGHLSR